MTVTALVALPDGSQHIRDSIGGPAQNAVALGEQLAERLLEQGAAALLAASQASND